MDKNNDDYFDNTMDDIQPRCETCVHNDDCNVLTPDMCDNYMPNLDEWRAGM
jgi:hypothetical protein